MEVAFKVSPRILDHLGVAAYTTLPKVLAELCSNCYDADAGHVWIDLPDDFKGESQIIIRDDGIGMSPNDIRDNYLFIGYNRRSSGEKTKKKQRPIIGNKGLGKLAGFGVAHTIEIISVKDKVESRLVLNKEVFDDFNHLSECFLNIETKKSNQRNGTQLVLTNLSNKLKPIQASVLREHLFKVLPNNSDFVIKVNNIKSSAKDIPGKKMRINHTLDGIGTLTGYYVIADVRQKHPGVTIRVRRRMVTEPSLFGLEKRSHFSFSAEKIIGEVDADFLDPFINTSRDNFLAEIEEVQVVYQYLHDFFQGVVDEIEKEAVGKRTKHIIDVPDVQKKLEKLPPHIRTKARQVIEGVISKLKVATDEEVNELVDWIIKYFESNVLRELMNSIIQADSNDIEKLSELIKDWGVRQLNNVSEIIREQINIILKLEELTASDKSLEIELHKLIEGNLWLIREGLELWASDKPLKKVLEEEFDKRYAENEDERPDIVCRSQNQGHEAIILEFKRPRVKVKMEHVTQALGYTSIIKKHRPNLTFETFVIGREYSEDVLAAKDNIAKSGIYLWSFSEILQRTRARFEKILEILNA